MVTKIITKSNEKVRASIYESLSTSKGENHINNIQKWEKNYGIKIDRKAINKALKTILKIKVEPRIKTRKLKGKKKRKEVTKQSKPANNNNMLPRANSNNDNR